MGVGIHGRLALNDHDRKFEHPSWFTGKLSDFCWKNLFSMLLEFLQ